MNKNEAFFFAATLITQLSMQGMEQNVSDLYQNETYINNRLSIYQYASQEGPNLWERIWEQLEFHGKDRDSKEIDSILEVGCGNGTFWDLNIKNLRENSTLTLSDLSPAMLNIIKKKIPNDRAGISYQVADVEKLPYPDNSFDKTLCHFVLFYTEDPEKAFAELVRVTKKGEGLISLITLKKNFCKILYEIAHKLDPRFPDRDMSIDRFDQNKIVEMSANFSGLNRIFSTKISIDKNANLRPFLESLTQEYHIDLPKEAFDRYQKMIQEYIDTHGVIECFSEAVWYLLVND